MSQQPNPYSFPLFIPSTSHGSSTASEQPSITNFNFMGPTYLSLNPENQKFSAGGFHAARQFDINSTSPFTTAALSNLEFGTNFTDLPDSDVFMVEETEKIREEVRQSMAVSLQTNRSEDLPTSRVENNDVNIINTEEAEHQETPIVKTNKDYKVRVVTGTVKNIAKWYRSYTDYVCYYEIIGKFILGAPGPTPFENSIFIRDEYGELMEVIYNIKDDINLRYMSSGRILRCVGRMITSKKMYGVSVRPATFYEEQVFPQLCAINKNYIKVIQLQNNEALIKID